MSEREPRNCIRVPSTLGEVWEDECKVEAFYEEGDAGPNVTIAANQEGLMSLAKVLLFIAKEEHEEYYHVHFDQYSGLESSSNVGIIFQKVTFSEPPNR